MNKKTLGFVGAAALAFVALIPSDAFAGSHTFAVPVGSCVQTSSSGTVGYDLPGMSNTSTTDFLTLECGPPYTVHDGSGQTVTIAQVIDNTTTNPVTCWMFSYDLGGTVYFSGGTQSTTSAATGNASFAWVMPAASTNTTTHTVCMLPPNTGATASRIVGLVTAG